MTYPQLIERLADPFYPRFWPERMEELAKRNALIHKKGFSIKPIGVFVVDMGDLFGIGIPEKWTNEVLDLIGNNSCYDRFYLLTHQPQNLIKFTFPLNCWVGVTATGIKAYQQALAGLAAIQAKIKFLSIEPFLERIPMVAPYELSRDEIQQVIIGAMTGKRNELIELNKQYPDLTLLRYGRIWTLQPQKAWVEEIVDAADRAGIPVFQKDNLKPLLGYNLRQELPDGY